MNYRQRLEFFGWISKIISRSRRRFKLGNVEFWRDRRDGICYSLPTSEWDVEKLSEDIAEALTNLKKKTSNNT